jgi:hypothetical protein
MTEKTIDRGIPRPKRLVRQKNQEGSGQIMGVYSPLVGQTKECRGLSFAIRKARIKSGYRSEGRVRSKESHHKDG